MLSKTSPFGRRLGIGSYQPGGMRESRGWHDFLRPATCFLSSLAEGIFCPWRSGLPDLASSGSGTRKCLVSHVVNENEQIVGTRFQFFVEVRFHGLLPGIRCNGAEIKIFAPKPCP
jgi:hypothetical protein